MEQLKQEFVEYLPSAAKTFRSLVIMGMPKSGTTLPLTLLDSHPQLITLPEELRFFHTHSDIDNWEDAFGNLFTDGNILLYQTDKEHYSDYRETGGTGFGQRDYSNLDYALFKQIISWAFEHATDIQQRYTSIFLAYELARGKSVEELKNSSEKKLVAKAPHNELFFYRWSQMLGQQGQYLLTVRDPYEHYLSLNNVQQIHDKPDYDIDEFINSYKSRLKLVGLALQEKQRLYILHYERLIQDPELCMREIAEYLEIEFNEGLLKPTKNNVPWAGNSSRGIKQEAIFANPQNAKEKLTEKQLNKIKNGLAEEMEILGYEQ